jgi:hypothetical protein
LQEQKALGKEAREREEESNWLPPGYHNGFLCDPGHRRFNNDPDSAGADRRFGSDAHSDLIAIADCQSGSRSFGDPFADANAESICDLDAKFG